MAPKSTLTARQLEALGAPRLAELLLEITANDAPAKRRLKLEITALTSPKAVAGEIGKRLGQIARAQSLLEGPKVKELAADLETQRRTIVDHVAANDPAAAQDLMWQLVDMADDVLQRSDDSNGRLFPIFVDAIRDLGPLAQAAQCDPIALAERAFKALEQSPYSMEEDLIESLGPVLGSAGLDHLKQRLIELSKQPVQVPADEDRTVIGLGSRGPIYLDQIMSSRRERMIAASLRTIADVQGDVDSYIAQYSIEARKSPGIAAELARRLLAAGRADDALQIVNDAKSRPSKFPNFDWEDARIEVLDALGRHDQAQIARWSCFERFLSVDHLRAHLKRLPDFDDVEAERRALDYVERFDHLLPALAFLVAWPALDRAARLVTRRAKELDGNHYELLSPAADALAGKYPLAATLALRAMIDFTLVQGRSARYRHAARHLLECESLAGAISDFGGFDSHVTYKTRLRVEHGRKTGFWSLLS